MVGGLGRVVAALGGATAAVGVLTRAHADWRREMEKNLAQLTSLEEAARSVAFLGANYLRPDLPLQAVRAQARTGVLAEEVLKARELIESQMFGATAEQMKETLAEVLEDRRIVSGVTAQELVPMYAKLRTIGGVTDPQLAQNIAVQVAEKAATTVKELTETLPTALGAGAMMGDRPAETAALFAGMTAITKNARTAAEAMDQTARALLKPETLKKLRRADVTEGDTLTEALRKIAESYGRGDLPKAKVVGALGAAAGRILPMIKEPEKLTMFAAEFAPEKIGAAVDLARSKLEYKLEHDPLFAAAEALRTAKGRERVKRFPEAGAAAAQALVEQEVTTALAGKPWYARMYGQATRGLSEFFGDVPVQQYRRAMGGGQGRGRRWTAEEQDTLLRLEEAQRRTDVVRQMPAQYPALAEDTERNAERQTRALERLVELQEGQHTGRNQSAGDVPVQGRTAAGHE